MSAKNTVCLVAEDADLRKTLTASFKSAGLTLVGFASGKEYLDGLDDHKPYGCLVVETRGAGNGLEMIKELSQRYVVMPVIVLVPHGAVSLAVQAMKAGAFDVVEKPIKDDTLIESVRKATALFGKLQKIVEEREIACERIASLTERETQVIDLMVKGMPNREIAAELGISPKTLDIHRSNVMDKIEARTVADLCRAHLLSRLDTAHLHLLV